MKKSNDTYHLTLRGKNVTEHYYRDAEGWVKVSNRGRVFRMSAEQVLNHLLPALAFSDLGLTVTVAHHEDAYWKTLASEPY